MKEKSLEQRLWDAADNLRANSKLRAADYAEPVLGLIFLRFADFKFQQADLRLREGRGREATRAMKMRERKLTPEDYHAQGIMYLPEEARYRYLLTLPESQNIGKKVNEAIKAIEKTNPSLKGVLPRSFTKLDNSVLISLLKNFSQIELGAEGDKIGKIYEYFLGKFAMVEGRKGGEFYTPTSIVKLIVEVIEPFGGRVFDPACGSGGMFVQSFNFIKHHQKKGNDATKKIMIYGQEKEESTVRLCKMNLAVHGLEGEIKNANTYYENIFKGQRFDFVMANPPFNVNGVDKEKVKGDERFNYGIPRPDNANYLWIQVFLNSLNEKGRAGFVMANSAADARQSEMEIRKKMIEDRFVDVMISVGPNFFYTVTLPCSLWFFDKGKRDTNCKDKVLFIDVRNIYRQIDRAHRDFTSTQIEFIANIVRLYKGEKIETESGSKTMLKKHFPDGKYRNISGLCKVAAIKEIEEQGYSLNPGRYVGVAEREEEDFDFKEKMEKLQEEFAHLNAEANKLEQQIFQNMEFITENVD